MSDFQTLCNIVWVGSLNYIRQKNGKSLPLWAEMTRGNCTRVFMLVVHISSRSSGNGTHGTILLLCIEMWARRSTQRRRGSLRQDKEATKATVFRMTISLWVPTSYHLRNCSIENEDLSSSFSKRKHPAYQLCVQFWISIWFHPVWCLHKLFLQFSQRSGR